MLSMLLSIVVAVLLLAVVAAVAVGLTVVPFVLAVDMAERRRFSATRWGGIQLGLLAVAALAGLVGVREGHLLLLSLPAVLLCWTAPLVLSMLGPADRPIGGYQGAHES